MSSPQSSSSAAPLPSIYALSPPHGAITDTNHGPYVVITAWIMMSFFSICVLTRLLTRFVPVTVGGIDDALSGLSMLFGIAQTAAIHVSASNGLGQHQSSLSVTSFAIYAKSYYASNLLFLITIYFAKISLVFLIIRLSPARTVHRVCYATLLTITLWVSGEIFSFAFQCNLPSPWDYRGRCPVSIPALYYSLAAGDILTDLAVIVLPAYVIWNVQIPARKRWAVISVFSSRIVVIICSAIRISTLPSYLNSPDRSWEAVTPQTWLQVIQCLSILTACVPCLKPFLESLESGFMDISMKAVTGTTYGAGYSHKSSGSRHNARSGNNSNTDNRKSRASRSGTGSYMMTSLTSQNGGGRASQNRNTTDPNDDVAMINSGKYLDVSSGPRDRRSDSVAESERSLTGQSSEAEAEAEARFNFHDHGIRVTREVDVRDERRYSENHGVVTGDGSANVHAHGNGHDRRW